MSPCSREPDQGALMASTGQVSIQAPQSMQVEASMTRASPFSLIELTGHTGSHAPQLIQSAVIVWAKSVTSFQLGAPSSFAGYYNNHAAAVHPQTPLARHKYTCFLRGGVIVFITLFPHPKNAETGPAGGCRVTLPHPGTS
jgi:hypothetical protein